MADKCMKSHSTLLVVREMKTQTVNATSTHQVGKSYRLITPRVVRCVGNRACRTCTLLNAFGNVISGGLLEVKMNTAFDFSFEGIFYTSV